MIKKILFFIFIFFTISPQIVFSANKTQVEVSTLYPTLKGEYETITTDAVESLNINSNTIDVPEKIENFKYSYVNKGIRLFGEVTEPYSTNPAKLLQNLNARKKINFKFIDINPIAPNIVLGDASVNSGIEIKPSNVIDGKGIVSMGIINRGNEENYLFENLVTTTNGLLFSIDTRDKKFAWTLIKGGVPANMMELNVVKNDNGEDSGSLIFNGNIKAQTDIVALGNATVIQGLGIGIDNLDNCVDNVETSTDSMIFLSSNSNLQGSSAPIVFRFADADFSKLKAGFFRGWNGNIKDSANFSIDLYDSNSGEMRSFVNFKANGITVLGQTNSEGDFSANQEIVNSNFDPRQEGFNTFFLEPYEQDYMFLFKAGNGTRNYNTMRFQMGWSDRWSYPRSESPILGEQIFFIQSAQNATGNSWKNIAAIKADGCITLAPKMNSRDPEPPGDVRVEIEEGNSMKIGDFVLAANTTFSSIGLPSGMHASVSAGGIEIYNSIGSVGYVNQSKTRFNGILYANKITIRNKPIQLVNHSNIRKKTNVYTGFDTTNWVVSAHDFAVQKAQVNKWAGDEPLNFWPNPVGNYWYVYVDAALDPWYDRDWDWKRACWTNIFAKAKFYTQYIGFKKGIAE